MVDEVGFGYCYVECCEVVVGMEYEFVFVGGECCVFE